MLDALAEISATVSVASLTLPRAAEGYPATLKIAYCASPLHPCGRLPAVELVRDFPAYNFPFRPGTALLRQKKKPRASGAKGNTMKRRYVNEATRPD
jgi:hypothetical protein